MLSGVVDVAEADHRSGFDRLNQVLTIVGTLTLTSHALINITNMDDLKGICHQLANEDRLRWVIPG